MYRLLRQLPVRDTFVAEAGATTHVVDAVKRVADGHHHYAGEFSEGVHHGLRIGRLDDAHVLHVYAPWTPQIIKET